MGACTLQHLALEVAEVVAGNVLRLGGANVRPDICLQRVLRVLDRGARGVRKGVRHQPSVDTRLKRQEHRRPAVGKVAQVSSFFDDVPHGEVRGWRGDSTVPKRMIGLVEAGNDRADAPKANGSDSDVAKLTRVNHPHVPTVPRDVFVPPGHVVRVCAAQQSGSV